MFLERFYARTYIKYYNCRAILIELISHEHHFAMLKFISM